MAAAASCHHGTVAVTRGWAPSPAHVLSPCLSGVLPVDGDRNRLEYSTLSSSDVTWAVGA